METLNQFIISLERLKDGMHQFDFQIDEGFFKHFEQSPIQKGNFDLTLFLDKRPDLLVLTFDFKGSFSTNCDRCLEDINLPLSGDQQLIVKYADEPNEDAEVIYITKGTQQLNIAKFAYEFICLAIPIIKVYDCENDENPPCNQDVLDQLYREQEVEEKEEIENPVWEALKNLKNDTGLSDDSGSEN
jgi:uncharacterized metal-binding protein YceD (DUF177 family)